MTRVQGACWTTGASRSGRQARPEVSETAFAPPHENAAVERREARVSAQETRTRLASVFQAVRIGPGAKARAPVGAPPPSQFARAMQNAGRKRAAAAIGRAPHPTQSGDTMFRTKVTFTERQTPEQRRAHAAHWRRHDDTRRAQCNMLGFWRVCARPVCRRNRTCSHDMHACFERHWALIPEDDKEWIRGAILAARDGATGDAAARAADSRRDRYLRSLDARSTPVMLASSSAATDESASAPDVRIRRL